MADTFIVHKEWLDSIMALPIEQQDKIIADFVRYGTGHELVHENDAVAQSFVNILKGRIDYSKNKYDQKLEMSKVAGRKKKFTDDDIRQIIIKYPNIKAQEVANMLGVSKSSIDHNQIWKDRWKP